MTEATTPTTAVAAPALSGRPDCRPGGAGGLAGPAAALAAGALAAATLALAAAVPAFGLGLGVVAVCLATLARPGLAAPIALGWVIVGGAVRKWVAPSLQAPLLFAAIPPLVAGMAGSTLARLRSGRSPWPDPLCRPFVAVAVGWCVLEALHPALPHPAVGALGLVIRVAPIACAYAVARWVTSAERLDQGLWWWCAMTVPLLVLGFVQRASPHESPLNAFVWGTATAAHLAGGGPVRVNATFAYVWGYAAFLQLAILLLLALATRVRAALAGWTLGLVIAAALANLFMTGARTAVYAALASVAAMLLLPALPAARALGSRARGRPPRGRAPPGAVTPARAAAVLVVAGAVIALTPAGREAVSAFAERAVSAPDSVQSRVAGLWPFGYLDEAGLTGFGLGATYQGSRQLVASRRAFFHLPPGFEEEPERILIELGLLGYALVYAMRWAIVVRGFALWRRLRDPALRPVALAATLFLLWPALHLEAHADNLDRELLYWATVGLLAALARIDGGGRLDGVSPGPGASEPGATVVRAPTPRASTPRAADLGAAR